ncbi:MAG: hypothetical protein ACXAEX_19150 [Promethearchaeota archaeon]|jgi:hypothetical protein
MWIEKLFDRPASRNFKISVIIGLILCFAVIPVMQYFTTLSGFPAQIFSSQLSFNGDLMKSYYAVTDIGLYRITALLDYFFMMGYGMILFSLSILIARRFGKFSNLGKIMVFMAICGVVAACCDAIENIFILAMLRDPTGFPNFLAISHSIFALIKWILLFIGIILTAIFGIISISKGKKNK